MIWIYNFSAREPILVRAAVVAAVTAASHWLFGDQVDAHAIHAAAGAILVWLCRRGVVSPATAAKDQAAAHGAGRQIGARTTMDRDRDTMLV